MTPENFVYWLQGFLELSHQTSLDEIQTKVIRDHLALVFEKKTPTYILPKPNFPCSPPLMGDTIQSGHDYIVDLSHTHIPVTC